VIGLAFSPITIMFHFFLKVLFQHLQSMKIRELHEIVIVSCVIKCNKVLWMFYGVGWVTCKKPGVVYSKRIIFKVSAVVEKLTKS